MAVLFRPSMQQNWPRDRKLILGLHAAVWKILPQMRTRPVITQVYIEKMFNKNIEIGFRSAVSLLLSASIIAITAK